MEQRPFLRAAAALDISKNVCYITNRTKILVKVCLLITHSIIENRQDKEGGYNGR